LRHFTFKAGVVARGFGSSWFGLVRGSEFWFSFGLKKAALVLVFLLELPALCGHKKPKQMGSYHKFPTSCLI